MTGIIISISILLLLAYVFDITSSKTKIPSVILLLFLGVMAHQITDFFEFDVPELDSILPALGTIGLILIVLEGSLELEINKYKLSIVGKSSFLAFFPMILFCFSISLALYYFYATPLKIGLTNTIPLAVISSAIAIPSAQNLNRRNKEFITFESSLSDIFGVILFNFITLNSTYGFESIFSFIFQLIIMIVISFAATLALALFLRNIKHHIKFIPIIIMIILIYTIAKIYHLPALIFILLFGLFMRNIDELRHYKFIKQFHPIDFGKEVKKFSELTAEMTFLVRALFFLLFGFLIEINEIINPETIGWAIAITATIFLLRFIFIRILKFRISPFLYLAPRGLITVLLFMSIPLSQNIPIINKSLIIQVILLTAFIMMAGLMAHKRIDDHDHE